MKIDKKLIDAVWNKGRQVDGVDSSKFRKDACGAWIARNQYGKSDNPMGWVISYKRPLSKGGKDELGNIRPFQVMNDRSKGDDYPSYIACVVAKGTENIQEIRSCKVKVIVTSKNGKTK